MELGGVSRLVVAALLAGCAPQPAPAPASTSIVTETAARSEPAPPAPMTLAERIRQEGWLVRFWEQLTPGQRRRVTTRLRQNSPPLAREETEAAPVWDGLGLPEREALVFGAGLPRP
jgi:hypothetical protein